MRRLRLPEIWLGLAIGLAIATLRLIGFSPIEQLELRLLDQRLRQSERKPLSGDVVIVAVDDESLKSYGRWPWPRERVAELMQKITDAGPAVIGVDLVQSEPTAECRVEVDEAAVDESCRPMVQQILAAGRAGDSELAAVVRDSGRVVLGYFFDDWEAPGERSTPEERPRRDREGVYTVVRSAGGLPRLQRSKGIVRNLPELTAAARRLGYFNFFPDPADGLYRRVPLGVVLGDEVATPLSLSMLAARWPERALAIRFGNFGVESVRFGDEAIPVAEDGQMLINYRGRGKTFPHVSAADVLEGKVSPTILRDKLVILGVTAVAAGDIRATPVDGSFPGVEIHANVLDNILRQDFVYQAAPSGLSTMSLLDAAIILVGSVGLAACLIRARGIRGAVLAAALVAISLGASQRLFDSTGIALRIVYPALAFALTYTFVSVRHFVAAERETRETRRVLDLYLSPALSKQLSEHPEMLHLGGEKNERTVLFSDVREFTTFSERLDPVELVELLNFYLGEMTDIVFHHDGMLDKYIGDGVMAVWGAPVPQADHAVRACTAALDMIERLRRINEHGAGRGWPELEVRVGLNSGQMVFGNMGSTKHLSLTVMGDNVNLGARLEGVNKLYGTAILASEMTVAATGDAFVVRELDRVRVKGKTKAVGIFEVMGLAREREHFAPFLRHFDAGLTAYRARCWQDAEVAFGEALKLRPNDGPIDLYLRRIQQYIRNPPPPDWEPVQKFGE